ncbi:unnamed protein product [Phyllotreta striolata]|uniref:Glucose-methanol-choline oxidoreductase N-terminal domain-containing protein n=1 Tax=Phyllotreta striolata TaxID=444603 RepID=A0A9N9TUB6_PHYSR|nr:unnamed protein product [Phyllotreta striolata]
MIIKYAYLHYIKIYPAIYLTTFYSTMLKKLLLVYFLTQAGIRSEDSVEYLENVVKKAEKDSLNYQTPTDASRYKPTTSETKDYAPYDFIIIGGGTTGSVIASRLSEENFTVLVLEAGQFADNGALQIPRMAQTGWLSDYNWGFKSIPQTTACLGSINNQCPYPRGRGVGGTTLMNGLIYDRGSQQIYNLYSRIARDHSWSYRNVLKYFKKSEHFHWTNPNAPVDPFYHGYEGLFDVQHKVPDIRINDLFLRANRELGTPANDANGRSRFGATIAQIYTKNGRRVDTGTAFVKPFLDRSNLKVLTGSYVTKIAINGQKRAERVIFTNNGTIYSAKANKEIILSAGSVSSPHILMLSGVGPKKHLESLGIKVVEDLEVGTKFLDQPGTKNFMFSSNYPANEQSLKEQLQEYLKGYGLLTAATDGQGITFLRVLVPDEGISDLEIINDVSSPSDLDRIANGWRNDTYKELWGNGNLSISFSLRCLSTKSVGTLRLKSNDPYEYPLIDPNYLSDDKQQDIEILYRGIQHVFKLADTPAFRSINMTYVTRPLSACKQHRFKSKQYWYCFLRQVSLTAAHPVATCAMGADRSKGAVVDSELRVFGVKGLRVADASVLPLPIDGHTSVPCLMVGEKISDVIKKQYL